jgi:RNA polymerase sigma factor (sigma-70 family)
MKNIKEMLEHYNDIEADIKDKQYAIIKLNNMTKDASTASYSNAGNQRDFYIDSSLELFVINKDEKIRNLEKEIELLKAKRDMLDGYINTLKPVAKQIIELYYKEQLTEQQVADRLEMQVSGVQKSKTASLEKMQKKYEENRKEDD